MTRTHPDTQPVTVAEVAAASTSDLAVTGPDDPTLRTRARPLSADALGSSELEVLVTRLWTVLDGIAVGVGLAAPQVGLPFALFLVDDREHFRFAIANPRRSLAIPPPARYPDQEGCLSWPGWQAVVERPEQAHVSGHLIGSGLVRDTALEAGSGAFEMRGFAARILDHELDHLQGRLYLDRMTPGSLAAAAPNAIIRPRGHARS